MSEAQQYTQESCENEKIANKTISMNYSEKKENDCVKTNKQTNKQKTFLQLRKAVSHRSEQNG